MISALNDPPRVKNADRAPETPLAHVQRHPRTFLDIVGEPGAAITARAWCVDCDYELELTEEDADRWAELGVPWRTGTE